MNNEETYKINPIFSLAVNLAAKPKTFVLFCGAGVSKDAGIPTGWDVVLDTVRKIYMQKHEGRTVSQEQLESWYLSDPKLKDMKYSQILHLLFPSMEQKRTYLKQFFDGKEPGEIHNLIAKLVLDGLIRFIITTNFDNLMEKALNNSGLEDRYTVISTNDQAKNSDSWDKVDTCRIYKLHGDIIQGRIRNSVRELGSLDRSIKKDFQEIIDRHGVIVLGYSGGEYDKGVMDCFRKREYHRYPIYWQYRSRINEQVKRIIKQQDGYSIKNDSAAGFLNELFARIEIARTQSEKPTREIIEGEIKQLLIRNNRVEIDERIEKDRNSFIEKLGKRLKEVNPRDHEDLWNTYVLLLSEAEENLIIGKYLAKHEVYRHWNEFLKIFSSIWILNKSGDQYGRDGLINQLHYSLFLVTGGYALAKQRFEFLKSLYEIKVLSRNILLNILGWNTNAQFIQVKDKKDKTNSMAPKLLYLLENIEKDNFPFEAKELEKWIKDFDLLTFIYSVKKPGGLLSRYWYPWSIYYSEYSGPQTIISIKNDHDYRMTIGQILFGMDSDEFMSFLKGPVKEELTKLMNSGSSFWPPSEDPLEALFDG